MNINDYEKILTMEMGIPNVSISRLSIEQAKEVIEALKLVFDKYPDLKNSICAIGDEESINNQMNLIRFSINPKEKWEDIIPNNANLAMNILKYHGLSILRIFDVPSVVFAGLSFGEEFFKIEEWETTMNKAVNMGVSTKFTATIKGIVYHEIGHLLDSILNISDSKEFDQILSHKKWNILTEIDFHAGTSKKELLAEAFSEYIANPNPSELVSLLGQLIDKKYSEYKGKNIFKINYKYKDFLERAQAETSFKR